MVKGFFIQYKFIIPEGTPHSSYTYQKLFRALYGYTQNVTKSNGKTYHYHRRGILSNVPYLRPGKNCVVIPQRAFTSLDNFFKTGKNPSHAWVVKGDWKAVFYMDEKVLEEAQVISSIKEQIARLFQPSLGSEGLPDLSKLAEKARQGEAVPQEKAVPSLVEAESIINEPWFKEVYLKDKELRKFYEDYRALKGQ
ncbi:Uncharacterised protein [uncultured archaeon]|nr:Uncharacterised protein [uncultured archaeon]